MNINIIKANGIDIAQVQSEGDNEKVFTDVQTALDFIAAVRYKTGCDSVVIDKTAVPEEFFKLSTRLAGDILQKFINYYMKVAIIGDYSVYTSKSLKDFIYESNKGKNIFFVNTIEQAIEKLSLN